MRCAVPYIIKIGPRGVIAWNGGLKFKIGKRDDGVSPHLALAKYSKAYQNRII
jgi:hypothetical protein